MKARRLNAATIDDVTGADAGSGCSFR